MFVTRIELWVTPGRVAEFEAQEARLHALLAQQPDLERCALGNSLGYPSKYVRMIRWQSRDTANAWRKGAALGAFLREHPNQGLYTAGRPIEAYEIVSTLRGSATAGANGHAVLVDWTIDARNAQAFEDSRAAVFEVRQRYGRGLAAQVLGRFLGGGGRYLAYIVTATRDDLQATNTAPEVQQFMQAHPWSDYGGSPPVAEPYEIVQTTTGQ
ncbi:MAG TPA: antibiotic biosynthesis monooxygenase [Chloroflexota bacterium]|jgi:heme-degrading monooxygenase HmoA